MEVLIGKADVTVTQEESGGIWVDHTPRHTKMHITDARDMVDGCRLVACSKCSKTTWAGCGQHAEAVMATVKAEERCICAK
ncbi:hypothetical protein HYPSUDRAFT_219446 [Hypholoma sublateritium FD-334 SS-4]|uniref:Uncharacterized protein n=1 Tax=Hypholoma sublateritium (strain FD-334 SS-4) TaxID=945553 RepID=A0A0D2NB83_HYPSF|nr:hypothetical protein HYPSUDRAFT_219446 [Hypholoma sublateritium FD-334 SS-4]